MVILIPKGQYRGGTQGRASPNSGSDSDRLSQSLSDLISAEALQEYVSLPDLKDGLVYLVFQAAWFEGKI